MILDLPYPPTINHYYNLFRGRPVISPRGKAYRASVAAIVTENVGRIPGLMMRFSGRLSVSVVATMPDRRKRDLDNIWKALLDAITKSGVWLDDSQLDHISLRRGKVNPPGRVRVRILPCSPPSTPVTATRTRSSKRTRSARSASACGLTQPGT